MWWNSVQVHAGMWRMWTRVSGDAGMCVLGFGHHEELINLGPSFQLPGLAVDQALTLKFLSPSHFPPE